MHSFKLVKKPSLLIVGISCRTANSPDAAPHDIPKLWTRFYEENIASKIPHKVSDEILGLYCEYEGDYTKPYTLVIGCQVHSLENIPEDLTIQILPSASYAVFKAVGQHPQAVVKTWEQIWKSDLKRTYSGDYEVYGEKFFNASPQEVEIHIAIDQ